MRIRKYYDIRKIAGVTVLVPSSVARKANVNIVSINATGLWLLKTLEEREFTTDEAVELMCREYGIDRDAALGDVDTLLGVLRQCEYLDE